VATDREAMLRALEVLVQSESPSLDKARCDGCANQVAELFQRMVGGRLHRHARETAGDHLEIAIGDGPSPVLILCHHDTVWPAGSLARLPFRVDGDRVSGPGCYDMKAGIVEAAFAIAAAHPKRAIIVLSTSDEEIGSTTSRELIEARAAGAAAVLVLEPAFSGGQIKTARKGVADYRLRVVGRAAHAGVEPEKGVSAIEELAHQIPRMKALADVGRGTTVNIGVIRGGTRSNVVAAEAEAAIDIRLATRDEATRVDRAMRALSPVLPGALVTVEGGMERPPMERTEGVARLAALAKTVAHQIGFELEETSTGGGSDGNFTAALGIPTLDGLGPDGGGAHADSEHLLISSWLQRTELLARLLERI
jgi:glutamate carboxypeptidase